MLCSSQSFIPKFPVTLGAEHPSCVAVLQRACSSPAAGERSGSKRAVGISSIGHLNPVLQELPSLGNPFPLWSRHCTLWVWGSLSTALYLFPTHGPATLVYSSKGERGMTLKFIG